jgi:eukaryotic-like serine/threonine-protein kinase
MLDATRPYLVLEHLEGRDLAQELSERRALPRPEAIEIALQSAEALAAAHARGIVHRDIKPANLFLTRETDGRPLVKVLDFGIAKALHDSEIVTHDGSLTESAAMIGSPRYMSPEQLRDSGDVDARTDLWALGAVLYELVSGHAAFDGPNLAVITSKILTQQPAPLPDPILGRVIARCLEKDRDARYASALELARALAPLSAADESARLERMQSGGDTLRSGQPLRPVARSGASRRSLALALALAASLVAIGGWWLTRPTPAGPSAAPSPAPPPVEPARSAPLPAATLEPAPPPSPAPIAPARAPSYARHPSPSARASATAVTPAPSGVDVQSDGLRDRK